MRKILSLGAAVAIAMVCLATPATAGPTRVPAPAGAVDLPDIFCGFGVHAEFPKNKEYSLIYSDAGGTVTHIRTTGALAVTLTNESNGHTHTFNISGPGDLVPNEDGSTTLTATGHWIFFFAPGQLGVGSPGAMVDLHRAHRALDGRERLRPGDPVAHGHDVRRLRDAGVAGQGGAGGRPQSLRARSEYISGRLPT